MRALPFQCVAWCEAGRTTEAPRDFGEWLPLSLLNIFWIDALFALFTERHQRAFELLSRTRTVRDA